MLLGQRGHLADEGLARRKLSMQKGVELGGRTWNVGRGRASCEQQRMGGKITVPEL